MTSASQPVTPVTLDRDYRLCAGLFLLSLPLAFLSPWATTLVALFALFLTIQTATLRLVFTDTALEVYRGEARIRLFPYTDWLHWEIYVLSLPILFYFREINSIHFLPIIFNARQLQQCLETFVGLESLIKVTELQESDPSPSEATSEATAKMHSSEVTDPE